MSGGAHGPGRPRVAEAGTDSPALKLADPQTRQGTVLAQERSKPHAPESTTALEQALADWLGAPVALLAPASEGGSAVFGVGTDRVARVHGSVRAFEQERRALRDWTPRLGGRAPTLREERPELRALVMDRLPGRPAAEAVRGADAWRVLLREVGQWATRLHGVAFEDGDTLAVGDALRLRAAAWLRRARRSGAEDTARWAERLANLDPFAGAVRVPCHRDLQARNWLVEDGRLRGVVDFEHARPDHWMADLVKLPDEVPDLPEDKVLGAFLEGHGQPRALEDARVRRQWRWMRTLHGLATRTWAWEKGDAVLEARGVAILDGVDFAPPSSVARTGTKE
ncbi:MAG: aminoglycoside phosphotransferase family protein [Deltaproteobacteria bacterium]|nr:MAG: aminoglycoside phosphotransferase family protein [Deltaproteobacteria bacterium]